MNKIKAVWGMPKKFKKSSISFINEPLLKYKYNRLYRLFLINQLQLVDDIKNVIQLLLSTRKFKIPDDIINYTYKDKKEFYINELGVVFIKVSYKTRYDDKFENAIDKDVKYYPKNAFNCYFIIDFNKSEINELCIIGSGYVKWGETSFTDNPLLFLCI